MRLLRISNSSSGALLADRAAIADTSSARRTGLLKRTALGAGEGLWIVPTEGVHTVGMKFPIDVIFLSRSRRVLKTRSRLSPWRFAICLRAHSVLELPAGSIESTRIAIGDQLVLSILDISPSEAAAAPLTAEGSSAQSR